MKIKTSLFALWLMTSYAGPSFAIPESYDDPYEDTAEFMNPQVDTDKPEPQLPQNGPAPIPLIRNSGVWSYLFVLVNAKGEQKIITKYNENVLLKAASTQKLFTSWWSYQTQSNTDEYLSKMLKESDNAMARKIYLKLGQSAGMKDFFTSIGLPVNEATFTPADGSGLSYDSKVTCDFEVKLLKLIYDNPDYKKYRNFLAQPQKHGTLERRLPEFAGSLYGKTGTLADTVALTGYLETKKGTMLFCVLSNHLKIDTQSARKKLDTIVRRQYQSVLE